MPSNPSARFLYDAGRERSAHDRHTLPDRGATGPSINLGRSIWIDPIWIDRSIRGPIERR
jgi:hypothetical protein